MVLNYIIENRDFLKLWAGGFRSAGFVHPLRGTQLVTKSGG